MTTTPAMPELPEGVTLEDLLIPLRAALGTCHDTDWTLRQFKTHITHALSALATLQAQQSTQGDAQSFVTPAAPAMLTTSIDPRPLRYSLDDYHRAPSEGPLHFTWKDKPHRLLYDLIAAVAYYTRSTAQPAAVSDYEIELVARSHGTGGWQTLPDMIRFARTALALRPQASPKSALMAEHRDYIDGYRAGVEDGQRLGPQAVPMTEDQIVAAFKACDLEDPSKEGWIWRTRIKWARAIEAHHGITAPAGGEKQA